MHGGAGEPHEPVWLAAVERWLAGVIFAVAVSVAVVLAAGLPLVGGVFRAIEAAGGDAAMQAHRVLAPRNPIGQEGRKHPRTQGFVFIDLDAASCLAIEKAAWCSTRTPASPALAARVAAAAVGADPRVVVIDTPLWDRGETAPEEDFQRLAAAMASHPRVRVVATAPFRPAEKTGQGLLEPSFMPPVLAAAGVKFAPAYAWNEGAVMRRYPRTLLALTAGPAGAPGKGGRYVEVPSLPELAARYANAQGHAARLAKADCQAWPIGAEAAAACGGRRLEGQSKVGEGGDPEALPLFTLPSLATPAGTPRSAEAGVYMGLYDRLWAGETVALSGALTTDPSNLARKVVIVGTSARSTLDWHDTPLGEMAGAEVILNATRAFAALALLREPPLHEKILREAAFAVVGSVPFLGFWFLALGGRRWLLARPGGRWIAWAPPLLLFAPTIIASGLLMIFVAFWNVSAAFMGGHTWDLFTPLAALSLDGFSHASSLVSMRLEEAVSRSRRWLARRWTARRRRTPAPPPDAGESS